MTVSQIRSFPFETLSPQQLYSALKLRSDVFVVEQTCVYPDLDNKDTLSSTLHLLCETVDAKGTRSVVAYARCLAPGVSYPGCSIGRVVVASSMRGKGLANQLMQHAISICHSHWPNELIQIGAQVYLQDFYKSLGFESFSDPYDEDGIMHIDMQTK